MKLDVDEQGRLVATPDGEGGAVVIHLADGRAIEWRESDGRIVEIDLRHLGIRVHPPDLEEPR